MNACGTAASPGERASASTAIRAIQAGVFELVLQEPIDADDALVVFLALSNQALTATGWTDGLKQTG